MPEPFVRRIEEQVVEGRRLGRHVRHDPRSRQYEAEQADAVKDCWHAATGLPLDQGNRGSCTAEATCGALNSKPNFTGARVFMQADASQLYDAEIVAEGGNPATDDPGGTGLEVCKVAKAQGLISSYTHTFSFDSALKALVLRPVMFGTNWYDSMDTLDGKGFAQLTPGAQVRGGHEYVADAISLERKAVGCWNSWGSTWGPWGGRFWLPFDALERLLAEQGDCTVPVV